MSLEQILLLIFVGGISAGVLFKESVLSVIGAVSGLIYIIVEIVRSIR